MAAAVLLSCEHSSSCDS